MTDGMDRGRSGSDETIIHLPKRRSRKSSHEDLKEHIDLSVAKYFREQNLLLLEMNKRISEENRSISDKVQRLTTGIERLLNEMHGMRTGKKSEAFARVGGADAPPDLPTVSAESAVIYTLTAKDIGQELDIHSSQIGLLLSAKGLNWAGIGDYQEINRNQRRTLPKFWHHELPDKLRKILGENLPECHEIKDAAILAIFRKWNLNSMSR